MANSWLRLWHDMPTDPKWRTIARASGQRIGDVMAVYVHLMVCGSSNTTERGRTTSFNSEDVASALDLETEQVSAIVNAMQGRVLEGDTLAGWEKRQVQREDGSAERARAWREAQKEAEERAANAGERIPNAGERQEEDKDTEKEKKRGRRASPRCTLPPDFYPDATGIDALKGLSLAIELEAFRNHHKATGTLMADWQAAFRKWVANSHKWAKPGQVQPTGRHTDSAEDTQRMLAEHSKGTKPMPPELRAQLRKAA